MGEWAAAVIDLLLGLPASTIYLLIGVLCWAEAAFFLGFITPGELAVATGGILASRGQVSLVWLIPIIFVGTIAGNTTGYWLGKRWGAEVLKWKPLQRTFGRPIGQARDFMAKRGEWAIVLGRFATPTRIVVPFLVGSAGLPYRRFILFDAPTTIVWATAWTVLGFILGESWDRIEQIAGTAAIFVLILFVSAVVIRWVAARVAANQSRMQAAFQQLLRLTGTRGVARRLAPGFVWVGRRLNPALAHGLSLTVAFVALMAAAGAVSVVLTQTQAVAGLALLDFPVLEWMVATRTDEAVQLARSILIWFRWPGLVLLALPFAVLVGWWAGITSGLLMFIGIVGAGAGAWFLDIFVVQGVVPGAEFPSVPVAVAAALLVHATATTARSLGWGPSVAVAGAGVFLTFAVALGTVVAGWAAPSGIALGLALGIGWSTAIELPRTILGAGGRSANAEPDAPLPGPPFPGPPSDAPVPDPQPRPTIPD